MPPKVTLKDVAAAAGVTAMTVSRALRDSPKISTARRQEILALAQKLGYRPDPQISRLMSILRTARPKRRDTVIALLNTLAQPGEYQANAHQGAFFRGADQRARELGFKLEEFWVNEAVMRLPRLQGVLAARGIEALLLLPYGLARQALPLDYSRFAVAAIGRSQADQPFHRSCQNHYRSVQIAIAECHRRSLRRIGMVLSEQLDARAGRRYSSAILHHLHVSKPAERVPLLDMKEWNPQAFRRWYDRHRPEVILCTSRVMRERFAACGLHAPRDYSFVNLDLIEPDDRCAGIDQNYGLVGAAAVDLLAYQLNHNERGLAPFPKTVLIDGFWRDGDSMSANPATT